MDHRLREFGLIILCAIAVQSADDFVGEKSIGKHQEYLEKNGKYLVEWEAYTDTQTIIFELTAESTGFVGFGISPVGGMDGADIIIGGVYANGSYYFSVRIFSFSHIYSMQFSKSNFHFIFFQNQFKESSRSWQSNT